MNSNVSFVPTLAAICAGLCLVAPQLHAADWLAFRAGGGAGLTNSAGLPAQLSLEKDLVWDADLPGRGLSSPLVVGDRVILTSASGVKQDQLHVQCFSAKDGSRLWERRLRATGRTMCHEKTCNAAPSPASDGRFIYAIFSSNDLVCLDLEGNVRWIRALMIDHPNASNSLGMSSSLLVAGGVLIVQLENQSESFVAGLDATTGMNRWRIERAKTQNWTSPVLWADAAGRQLALLQSSKGVDAVVPATGETVWSHTDRGSSIPSAAVAGGLVIVPGQGLTALAPQPDGQAPKKLWQSSQIRAATPSPFVLGGRVYAVNDAGVLSCGDLADGNRLWQLRLKGPFSASPVGGGNTLYLFNEKGLAQVVDVGGAEGVVTAEFDLGEPILGTPALAHGSIFVRSDRHLWRLGRPQP